LCRRGKRCFAKEIRNHPAPSRTVEKNETQHGRGSDPIEMGGGGNLSHVISMLMGVPTSQRGEMGSPFCLWGVVCGGKQASRGDNSIEESRVHKGSREERGTPKLLWRGGKGFQLTRKYRGPPEKRVKKSPIGLKNLRIARASSKMPKKGKQSRARNEGRF